MQRPRLRRVPFTLFNSEDRSTPTLTTGKIHYSMFNACSPPPVDSTFDAHQVLFRLDWTRFVRRPT